jgi:hypothetical protein
MCRNGKTRRETSIQKSVALIPTKVDLQHSLSSLDHVVLQSPKEKGGSPMERSQTLKPTGMEMSQHILFNSMTSRNIDGGSTVKDLLTSRLYQSKQSTLQSTTGG